MILDEVSTDIDIWPYAERFLGQGTRTYSQYSADMQVADAFHPQRGRPTFDLPTFWIPDDAGSYLTNGIDSHLHATYRVGERFMLPVHPQTLATFDREALAALRRHEPGPAVTVIASANVRTVFVTRIEGRPVERHFLKLHYPLRLSRFTRRLRRPIIGLQLWVADELSRIGVPFLPEVGGGVFGHDTREAWGYLLREREVRGQKTPRHTVPLFALYGTDVRSPKDPTLVEQLMVRSGQAPARFLIDRIVRPIVRLWLRAATQVGCALEMHGQNALFGFSDDLSDDIASTSIMYRDCGVYVDPVIRAARGLPGGLPPVNVIGRDVGWPSEEIFSLAYDSFLGHHALGSLARVAADVFGVRETALQDAARAEFHRYGEEASSLLAPTVHYYDDHIYGDGDWKLLDTGATPVWR
jgi:hypothetical protein